MFNQLMSKLLIGLINGLITVYTYTTLPFYYYQQKPWIRLDLSNTKQTAQEDEMDSSSPWRRITPDPILEAFEAQSVDSMLETAATTNGKNYIIAGVKVHEEDKYFIDWLTYGHIIKRVNNIAKGLQLVGVSAGDKVLIFAETRLEWMLCAFAIFKLGSVATTLFPQLSTDGVIHGINQTQVKYVITTKNQLKKLRTFLLSTPSIQKIIDIDGMTINDGSVEIMSLRQVENNGIKSDIKLSEISLNKREDQALIMYTSGTTGNPKGVIVTHGQLLAQAKSTMCLIKEKLLDKKNQCYAAYLPLGHMFEFTAELVLYGAGIRLGYATPLTLLEGAAGLGPNEPPDLILIKPTIFLAVPLVLDRIRRGVTERLEHRSIAKGTFNLLISYKDFWRNKGYTTPICNFFLCRKAKQMLGSNVEFMLVGGAPVSIETERLISLIFDVTLFQGYGGTEVCGASNARHIHDLTFGHTGPPMSGFRVKLVDWADGGYFTRDKPNSRGEIVVNGDSVVSGYYMLDTETNDAFRYENGEKWYYTGDIGEVDHLGYFKIIDRRKDLLKLQNGEYYSLGKVEAAVKSCPYIENICVYGISTHDYLIALVIPSASGIQTLAKRFLLQSFSFDQLCKSPKIESSVLHEIRDYGLQNGLTKRELPAKIKLCAEEWTTENGLLTAALKLKRTAIIDKYKNDINKLFDEQNNNYLNNNK